MNPLLEQLEDDHRRILKLLYLLSQEVEKFSRLSNGTHHCDATMEILDYIQTYPEAWHHPVEDLLFAQLVDKLEDLDSSAIEALLLQHPRLEAMGRQVSLIFGELQAANIPPPAKAQQLLRRYHAEQMSHIQSERKLFKLAEQVFSAEDWRQLRHSIRQQLGKDADTPSQAEYQQRCQPLLASNALTSTGLH